MLASAANIHAARWMRWLADNGCQVIAFSDDDPTPLVDFTGIRRVPPHWSLWNKALTFKLRGGPFANNRDKWKAYARAVTAEAPDVLHAQEALCYGPTLARLPGFPRVLTPWGADAERLAGATGLERRLLLDAFRAADVVTTNGPGLERHWSQLAGVPEDRFDLFSWGVEPRVFHRRDGDGQAAARARLGLDESVPILLSPRHAQRYWGVDRIIRAWVGVAAEVPGVLVVLRSAASGEEWDAIRALAPSPGSRVCFVDDYFPPEDMAALYSAARGVIMLPETDLLARCVLECMACGCVPILAPHRAYAAAAQPFGVPGGGDHGRGEAFFLADRSEDAVAAAIRDWASTPDDALARAGTRNAAMIRAHHDWDACAPRILKVYDRAIARHRSQQ